MMDLKAKTKTNLGIAVTFAVLLSACSSKAIKMEASELALDVPAEVEANVEASADDGAFSEQAPVAKKSFAKKTKRKALKSKHVVSKIVKKKKTNVAAAATVAKAIETPKVEQELSQYPSNDTLEIAIPNGGVEVSASMTEESSSNMVWMYVLAGLLIVSSAAAYVYNTRFSKKKRRRLVYNS